MEDLVRDVVAFLVPYLPYLQTAGQQVAEGAANKIGEGSFGLAKRIWGLLVPSAETRPGLQEAVADAAKAADDEDVQAALRVQLRKLLSEDRSLADELTRVLNEAKQSDTTMTQGDRNVIVKRDAKNTVIITGDINRRE